MAPVRLDETTIAALTGRAQAEGITTRSEAIRAAIRQWTEPRLRFTTWIASTDRRGRTRQ
ncbi:ribbon-helix-helix protein, CopG family [Corynebacterium variabile]|uniref:ribbon-helix-helix protein, CopG family n=1 Tax=Corynebacterium variabile TaxID=1727 RepID=UPI003BB0B03F